MGSEELGVHTGADSIWNPEIMEYPRVLVSAIQQDAMVPIIDSDVVDSVGILTTGTRTYFCR